ncbi:protein tramtrack, beta isoform isoform X1 [Aphidius gifuensis]|nr:protein tramtrack, beta isoform isoform X1 [Aphidius gifuensis]XP_044003144.1 protein tramtrack, beta isoform isoform X1 [Aphidius gifuensis]
MEGQQFCLRWHNFQNTLLSSLPKLLDVGYLTDVTLSAGGRHIRAHRIILSACSFYFKELFKDLSTLQHPVIVLPGMEYANLCALVTFMYNGEVNIYQEQLPALLAMAETLHIRGLADIAGKNANQDNGLFGDQSSSNEDTESMCDNTSLSTTTTVATTTPQTPTTPTTTSSPLSLLTTATTTTTLSTTTTPSVIKTTTPTTTTIIKKEIIDGPSTDDCIQETQSDNIDIDEWKIDNDDIPCSVKTKPYYSINAKLAQKEKKQLSLLNGPLNRSDDIKYIDNKNDDNSLINDEQNNTIIDDGKSSIIDTNYRYLTSHVSSRVTQTNNKTSVTCLICGKQLSNQYNLRVHMETHSNSSYSCTACSHVSRSRDALRKHVSYRHPVATPHKRPRFSLGKP